MLLFSSLLFLFINYVAGQGQYVFTVAPNLMRAGVRENVLVNLLQCDPRNEIDVIVTLKDGLLNVIHTNHAVINAGESRVIEIYVDPELLPEDDGTTQYLTLETNAGTLGVSSKQVMLSYQSGYVFIQTDKPIYTPSSEVKIRVITLDQDMLISNSEVVVEVKTPQNITVFKKEKQARANSGFVTIIFKVPEEPLFGNWTIVAHYGHELKANTSVQFEIKEYVLPTFSVTIEPPVYIVSDTESIDIVITAKYVYGKPVRGNVYMRLGVLEHDGTNTEIKSKPAALSERGECLIEIPTAEFEQGWFEEYVNHRLHIAVTVVEAATGKIENASDISARFVETPFMFVTNRTMKYFKKGLPFDVKVDLLFANGQPATGINVEVEAVATVDGGQQRLEGDEGSRTVIATNNQGQVNFRLDVAPTATRIDISLTTTDEEHNADHLFVINPYASSDGESFLMIRLQEEEVLLGESVTADVLLKTDGVVDNLHFLVVAKGQILASSSVYRGVGLITSNFIRFNLEAAMIPFARLVVYYISAQGKVVVDSVLIEAFRQCENEVRMTLEEHEVTPGEAINLRIEADPNTQVGLLVVDKAVYLLRSYHQLTREKMFNRMGEYDLGCGPGGGADNAGVFKDAGLTVITNAELNVPNRRSVSCPRAEGEVSRRRRSLIEQLGQYSEGSAEYEVCQRGHRIIRPIKRWTCAKRVERMQQEATDRGTTIAQNLLDIFKECCEQALFFSQARADIFTTFADIQVDAQEVQFRTDFKETWTFEEFVIGNNGHFSLPLQVPGSITKWSFQAVGVSSHSAMCVAHPKDLRVFQNMFIQLSLPYSVVRNEQVEVLATVFNYHNRELKVKLYFKTGKGLCAEAEPNQRSIPRNLTIPANDAVSVRYVVIPIETGEHIIEAAAFSVMGMDGIRKKLKVEPEGVYRTEQFTSLLDPEHINTQNDEAAPNNEQLNLFDIHLPENYVPGSESCKVKVIGTLMGPIITTIIEGLDNLIRIPRGCGEQTMIYTSPNIYVLKYLTDTDTLTPEAEAPAFKNIQDGYLREQNYRRGDGSFSAFPSRAGSTWLTAFVAKVFCQASTFINVDPQVTCGALNWIKDNRQRLDGSFDELSPVYHQEMIGGVRGDGGVSMTAFILTAFKSCECDGQISTIAHAVDYLENHVDSLNRPYTAAVVTYALALVNSQRKHDANAKLFELSLEDQAAGTRHWKTPGVSNALAVETAGYAILAQVLLNNNAANFKIVKWLTEQQNYGGGFYSTQDTVVALEALAEYSTTGGQSDLNLLCNIDHTASKLEAVQYAINEGNALVQREQIFFAPEVSGQLVIQTSGQGTGQLAVEVSYSVVPDGNNELELELCAFDIETTIQPSRGDNADTLIVQACTSYLRPGQETGMAIMDIGIFSGYQANKDDLDALVANEGTPFERYERSQRAVILYLDVITNVEICARFEITKDSNVGNIQAVPVTVYDYYDPDETCTRFYKPAEGSALLDPICEGQTCTCASAKCTTCAVQQEEQLYDYACSAAETFAYEVEVTNTTKVEGFFVMQVFIIVPLKQGDDAVIGGDTRLFWIRDTCKCPKEELIFTPGNRFMIIGEKYLPYTDRDGIPSAKYYLDEKAFVEHWPAANERGRKKKRQARKLGALKLQLAMGCQ